MGRFYYVIEVDSDDDLDLAELEQAVIDYVTPEHTLRVAAECVDAE